MCRSIKTLREPHVDHATAADVSAAALQYVRKISGFRAPSVSNKQVFDAAVAAVAAATADLLAGLEVRAVKRPTVHTTIRGQEFERGRKTAGAPTGTPAETLS